MTVKRQHRMTEAALFAEIRDTVQELVRKQDASVADKVSALHRMAAAMEQCVETVGTGDHDSKIHEAAKAALESILVAVKAVQMLIDVVAASAVQSLYKARGLNGQAIDSIKENLNTAAVKLVDFVDYYEEMVPSLVERVASIDGKAPITVPPNELPFAGKETDELPF